MTRPRNPPPCYAARDATQRIVRGISDDPFAILGPHLAGRSRYVTAFDPDAAEIAAVIGKKRHRLDPVPGRPGLFSGKVPGVKAYILNATNSAGATRSYADPYRFGPVVSEFDTYLVGEGTHRRLWDVLGAHAMTHEAATGTHFAVWAPNASRVSVVGNFNGWNPRFHPMRRRGSTGVWELFLPGVGEGAHYKYDILGPGGEQVPQKADPLGFGAEHPPGTASVVRDITGYGWSDQDWMAGRAARQDRAAPVSIYEVHLGSWRRKEGGRPISYREAAEELIAYVADMGFTHIELLPISEHPFEGSWGYQPLGLYAPSVRYGPPHEFRDLVNAAHRAGIGVILDWVPGHFPSDAHGLAQFDGTHLYEHADPREGFHQDWNTLIFNYGRAEVANYLIANALYWLEEYHIDGLRVDAVASMLYRDYSRADGEWIANKDGGRENYEAIAMLQAMNSAVYEAAPGIITVAEESTSYPKVSHPVYAGGLGFGFKWNMGWMNDTLDYVSMDPIHRRHSHDKMTFGMMYAFTENFILPISHDEVVHGKGTMLTKMAGLEGDKFATLRAFYAYMWAYPGKKLLFMGQEFAQAREWNHDAELDWPALDRGPHAGMLRLVRDLNRLYRGTPALHALDCAPEGFEWIVVDDADNSVFAWLRRDAPNSKGKVQGSLVVVCNFTPIERGGYEIGLPTKGKWREVLNTDAETYGGQGRGNLGSVKAKPTPSHGQPASASVTLPPLTCLILKKD